MPRHSIAILAAALLGGLALGACGCGSDTDSAPPESSAQALPDSGAPDRSLLTPATCRLLVNLPLTFSDALTGLGRNLDQTAATLKRFAEESPLDIQPDFELLAAASAKVAAALDGVDTASGDPPTADVIAKLQKLSRELDTETITVSSSNVSAWATKSCAGTATAPADPPSRPNQLFVPQ